MIASYSISTHNLARQVLDSRLIDCRLRNNLLAGG
ncbi:hypothetical protein DI53_0827 [Sphingobacterium deserti]|uniref:Uncharacterized protein n=1 Tax=Sphingobacterium deserti TaxID=1229276 RepID=A0A0B8T9M3_9SPHI|nr:hypothetical protein DI53_0827 [Sphingobacterium deserti]